VRHAPTSIVLVRHGETAWSRDGRHTGRTDVPLTGHGREQAIGAGLLLADLGIEVVLTSPLGRARETCALAGLAAGSATDPDLAEWDYGDYEGLTTAAIREQRPDWRLWRDGCPGGEPPAAVAARADRVLTRVTDVTTTVALFGHGHALRVLAARWLGLDAAGGALLLLEPATVSVLGWEHDTHVVTRWNCR
jgi:probable phosphoglycerate mutase